MRILVTGRSGQVARALAERGEGRGHALIFAQRPDFDLESAASIERTVVAAHPDLIVNAAAYTAVDRAEDEPEKAEAVNAVAPAVLAAAARRTGARIIQLSTDYVFDGSGSRPRDEDDPIGPLGVYGRTKAEGEAGVRAECRDHLIVRTAWVFSPFGGNFVKTMLSAARDRPTLRVVDDQVGNPTSALDLADGLFATIDLWRREPKRGLGDTVHLAGTGNTSWAGFARRIFEESARSGGPAADVVPIATADWPTRAARPLNARLATDKYRRLFGYSAPAWEQSLALVVPRLLEETA